MLSGGSSAGGWVSCLDLEGVLMPEIWIRVAEITRLEVLRLTTRDEPDYDRLMRRRLRILRENGIRLRDLQRVIRKIDPLPGARRFLEALRRQCQVILLSDTYYEFMPFMMEKLGYPTLFCNWLSTDRKGYIAGYHLRQRHGKEKAVRALRGLGFRVRAAGDSYNDIRMLRAAERGVLFRPPERIAQEFPGFPVAHTYGRLLRLLIL